ALGADDEVDVLAAEWIRQQFHRQRQPRRIGQEWRDIAKQNAGLGEIRDVADQPLQMFDGVLHGWASVRAAAMPHNPQPLTLYSWAMRTWMTVSIVATLVLLLGGWIWRRGERPAAGFRTTAVARGDLLATI